MRSRPRLEPVQPNRQARLVRSAIVQWEQLIGQWREWLQASGRPQTTVRLRCYQLRRFAEDHPVDAREGQIVAWLANTGWSPATKKSYRAALVSFYRWAHRRGYVALDPTLELPTVRTSPPTPHPAPEAALRWALRGADDRLRLMLTLAGHHGLRRGEIARVHTDDLLADLVGWSLTVHGKGAKDRIVPLDDELGQDLAGRPRGWLFPSPAGGHLTAQHVGKLIKRALPAGWTAHSLRHRFATVAYAGTHNLLAVQELLGHSRPETTRGYILTPQDDLRAAIRAAA